MNKNVSPLIAWSIIGLMAIIFSATYFLILPYNGNDITTSTANIVPGRPNGNSGSNVDNGRKNRSSDICPQDAKQCPDGSAVGRTGPNCEFAACPGTTSVADKIVVSSPAPNSKITSPVSFSGKARGIWFFEGSFPVEIYDSNGKLLGSAGAEFIPASEEDTWMTEDFINFEGEARFNKPTTDAGYILFKKDNPSDQRELDEEFELPVRFK